MIVIKNNILPVKGYKAMTLWPLLFIRKNASVFAEVDYNHEKIHGRQQIEVHIVVGSILLTLASIGLISFWWVLCTPLSYFLWYIIEYFIRCLAYGNNNVGYRNISFEQEAYNNECDFCYLHNRKLYAWIKYLNKKTYSLSNK